MTVQIIAEVGSVHDGSFGNACKLVEAAAACGVDAVKFQTHIAEAETLASAPSPGYFTAEPRIAYFERTAFTPEQWHELKSVCDRNQVTFLSSPFSLEAVALLEDVGAESYKIPSGEVTNLPLLERVAATGKPCLLSSGMSDWAELGRAVEVLRAGGPLTVLQCSSLYPCPAEQVGLNVLGELRTRYGTAVGYSDHSRGLTAAVAAVALGATVIEKHFTFSRLMYGSDASNATEPAAFARLVEMIRECEAMLAHPVDKDETTAYREMKRIFEKSVVTAGPIAAGTVLTATDLAFKKPGDGISAARYRELVGRRAARDLPADHQLSPSDLS